MLTIYKLLLRYVHIVSFYLLISSSISLGEENVNDNTYVGIGANSGVLRIEHKEPPMKFYGAPTAKIGYFFTPYFSLEGEYSAEYHLNLSSDLELTAAILNTISMFAKAYYNLMNDEIRFYGIAGITKLNSNFLLYDTTSHDTLPTSGHFSYGIGLSYGNKLS